MRIGAVLAAGGAGTRFASGGGPAKQFLQLGERPVYTWSLDILATHPSISFVVVVAPEASLTEICQQISNRYPPVATDKIVAISGGVTRQDSVRLGLEKLAAIASEQLDYVLVHDAARPFLSAAMIDDIIYGVLQTGACTLAITPVDTVKRISEAYTAETIDRDQLVLIQTPQAGQFRAMLEGHRKALANGLATTDDAAIMECEGYKVKIVQGSRYNLKITTAEDLALCQALANIKACCST